MNSTHIKVAAVILIVGALAMAAFKFLSPYLEDSAQRSSSDAAATKGSITVGVDNWVGYFPLCSPEMRKRMRRSGYLLACEDDQADYAQRMQKLKRGKLQFAVATVDSYLLNGFEVNFPGTIVAVIDESKGGDALVAWEQRLANIDALKQPGEYKIALTPNSPSAHLLKTIAVHFDIAQLRSVKNLVFADGSSDALRRLLSKEVDAAVVWEPDVSKALRERGVKKLLGTEQTEKLIVDILIVNRQFAEDHPEAIDTLLGHYFRTLKYYQTETAALTTDAAAHTGLPESGIETLLKGVSWINLADNAQYWFGIGGPNAVGEEALIDTIESTASILLDNGDFTVSPIPGHDPYRLTNSHFISDLFSRIFTTGQFGGGATAPIVANPGMERDFSPLSAKQWSSLREVGTLRVRPIVFQSGTDYLTLEGKEQLDQIVQSLRHYPHFRIAIRGHTSTRGDGAANKQLSQARADAVKRYLSVTYGIDDDRMLATGFGGERPLQRGDGESMREYQYRLSRVELALVSEAL